MRKIVITFDNGLSIKAYIKEKNFKRIFAAEKNYKRSLPPSGPKILRRIKAKIYAWKVIKPWRGWFSKKRSIDLKKG